MLFTGQKEKPQSYKSYKSEQFNKKLEKARLLKLSIQDLSLLPEDKVKLRDAIVKVLAA